MALPVGALFRSIMLNHWYHHRGQLAVYLRQVGAKVPAIYGPSADESPFARSSQRRRYKRRRGLSRPFRRRRRAGRDTLCNMFLSVAVVRFAKIAGLVLVVGVAAVAIAQHAGEGSCAEVQGHRLLHRRERPRAREFRARGQPLVSRDCAHPRLQLRVDDRLAQPQRGVSRRLPGRPVPRHAAGRSRPARRVQEVHGRTAAHGWDSISPASR